MKTSKHIKKIVPKSHNIKKKTFSQNTYQQIIQKTVNETTTQNQTTI